MAWKTIHKGCSHCGWSRDRTPVYHGEPGETLEMETQEASGGKLHVDSSVADLSRLSPDTANPVTGPIYIEGAQPGDLLEVTLLGFDLSSWGWTAIIPGFGLLLEDFSQPWLRISEIKKGIVCFGDGLELPAQPFPGTIGVAANEETPLAAIPPHRCGGNLDCRDVVEGASLFLPVEVPGALFSLGDTHAAQGGGEVCGTAIEAPMRVQLRFTLHKGRGREGLFLTSSASTSFSGKRKIHITLGVAPDLVGAARQAVSRMIDWLVKTWSLAPEVAYAWCSVRGDLRIAQIVNLPSYTVQFSMPYPG